ncbi:MAG: alpha-L-fucosidase, partial [Verrucomicrobia bacterium]|nr:alpha-L-fucosidase [Verrucomicrobiota bacterium]
FEVCMTLNDHWGYNKADQHWKPAGRVIRQLVETVSRGGNYLLNVGPTAEGEFPAPAVAILNEVGRWLEINGEGIYGTTGSPFLDPSWGGCTRKVTPEATTIYLQVLNWPTNGTLIVSGLKNPVQEAYLLTSGGHKPLATRATTQGLAVVIPAVAPDPHGSTVGLKIDGALGVEPQLIPRSADGSYTLTPAEAVRHGRQVRYDPTVDRDYITDWVDPEEWVEWGLQVGKPGRYSVQAILAASESASFTISAGDQTLSAIAPGTGDGGGFHVLTLGVIELRSRGKTMLAMRPVKDGWHPLLLRGLQLKPARAASAP